MPLSPDREELLAKLEAEVARRMALSNAPVAQPPATTREIAVYHWWCVDGYCDFRFPIHSFVGSNHGFAFVGIDSRY